MSAPEYSLEDLLKYIELPVDQRPIAVYRPELLEPEPVFSAGESARLMEIVGMRSPDYPKSKVGKLLIDLSWASSRLEGNTYTQLDTQSLIEYGKRNPDKPMDEAVMILNHKRAIEALLSTKEISATRISHIHALLADNTGAEQSRHFLEPHRAGTIRSYTPGGFGIQGTSYLPPEADGRPHRFIEQEFDRLIEHAGRIDDPINQSFYLLTRMPYLQPFYDANKRTSRICCNIPLLNSGLAPLSFVGFDPTRYIGGLFSFYELGDPRLMRNAYLFAYLHSAFNFLPFNETSKVEIATNRQKYLNEAANYVREGIVGRPAVWLSTP